MIESRYYRTGDEEFEDQIVWRADPSYQSKKVDSVSGPVTAGNESLENTV